MPPAQKERAGAVVQLLPFLVVPVFPVVHSVFPSCPPSLATYLTVVTATLLLAIPVYPQKMCLHNPRGGARRGANGAMPPLSWKFAPPKKFESAM